MTRQESQGKIPAWAPPRHCRSRPKPASSSTCVVHSLYSNKDIFLRELLSNASDALDKLKLESAEKHEPPGARIRCSTSSYVPDPQARTLTVSDSGIGMSRDELHSVIGTIAKSGTRELVEQLKAGPSGDTAASLIGQFGVGFYSAFMVASRTVEIVTRKAGADTATRWGSSGEEPTQSPRRTGSAVAPTSSCT